MTNIIFPPEEEQNDEQELIIFSAVADGKNVECAVMFDALRTHFDADYSDPLFAFMSGRPAIEKVAARMIAAGRHEDNGSILIRPEDI